MTKIVGEYFLSNSMLVSLSDPDFILQVGTRPTPTSHKPRNFLMRLHPRSGRHLHLSGLFPLPQEALMSREAYSLDYAGEYLTLILDRLNKRAIIRHREPGEYARTLCSEIIDSGHYSGKNYSHLRSYIGRWEQLQIDFQ